MREGSTITQNRELARIFSHKPTLVVGEETNRRWRHTGSFPQGYLYKLVGPVEPEDIEAVPHTSLIPGLEWNTRRDFPLVLDAVTTIVTAELLTKNELLQLAADGHVKRETADSILEKQQLPE